MGLRNLSLPHSPRRRRGGVIQFMQKETTIELLRRKFALLSGPRPTRNDDFDLDRCLVRLPLRFNDPWLDSPPGAASLAALVEAGIPRWPLVNRGAVNRILALLSARRARGLAAVAEVRRLASAGHPCPWAVLAVDVDEELRRLESGVRS